LAGVRGLQNVLFWCTKKLNLMNKTVLLLAFAMGLAMAQVSAQDPIFSQFHRSIVYSNPAASGLNGGLTFTAVSREQWGKVLGNSPVPGAFSTQYASIEWTSSSLKNAVSAFFLNDVEGDAKLRTQYGGINYCFVVPFDNWRALHNVRLGFGLYYSKKSIDWDQLLFSDQLHPKGEMYFLPESDHQQYYDEFRENPPWWTGLNAGLFYRYSEKSALGNGRQYAVGINATHALNLFSATSFESLQSIGTGLYTKFAIQGSAFLPLLRFGSKGNTFTPIFNGRIERQGNISSFTLGGDLLFKNIGLGLYYQNTFAKTILGSTDALIIAVEMEVPVHNGRSLEIGLSYDLNLNGLRSYTGGVFEVVLKYRISRLRNGVICPEMDAVHSNRTENIFNRNKKNKNLD